MSLLKLFIFLLRGKWAKRRNLYKFVGKPPLCLFWICQMEALLNNCRVATVHELIYCFVILFTITAIIQFSYIKVVLSWCYTKMQTSSEVAFPKALKQLPLPPTPWPCRTKSLSLKSYQCISKFIRILSWIRELLADYLLIVYGKIVARVIVYVTLFQIWISTNGATFEPDET